MSRLLSDGRRLRWHLVGLEEAMQSRFLPFFISWDDPEAHPGRRMLNHPSTPSKIAWVEVSGDLNRLRNLVDVEQVPVRFLKGPSRDKSLRHRNCGWRDRAEIVAGPVPGRLLADVL